jgi:hypothetical protein
MDVIVGLGLGMLCASVGLLVYFLVDCSRRNPADFPTLKYGTRTFSGESVKKIWTQILVVSFVLGVGFSQEVWHDSETGLDVSVPMGVRNYNEHLPFSSYSVKKITDEGVSRERTLSVPFLFLLGLYLYHRGVGRWEIGERKMKAELQTSP